MHCHLCTPKKDHLVLLEHSDARWVHLTDSDSLDWPPADIQVVDDHLQHLSSPSSASRTARLCAPNHCAFRK